MEKKLVFYSHIDSGNHGCEAITKSTCEIFESNKKSTYFFSENTELDRKCGLEEYGKLIDVPKINGWKPISSIIPRIVKKLGIDKEAALKYKYGKALKVIDCNTIALSTGGDVYCYDYSEWLTFLNDKAKKNGAKTVLWGCSIEENRLDERVISDLNNYDAIMTRESITYEMLINKGIKSRIYLFPDPAFVLQTKVNDFFEWETMGEIIGLNVSSHIIKTEKRLKLFDDFIRYILKNTSYSIMLIPHVSWEKENDIEQIRKLTAQISSDRIYVVDSELTCNEYKYIISKCKLYFGARTHSVIAAYSSCIPAIALSYSVKSIGIARDIFGNEQNLVIKINDDTRLDELKVALSYLEDNYDKIKTILNEKMILYKEQINEEKKLIAKL